MNTEYWIKKYPKPDGDAYWCDECLRWEIGYGFPNAKPPTISKVLARLAAAIEFPGKLVAQWLRDLADILKVRRMHARGELTVRGRNE